MRDNWIAVELTLSDDKAKPYFYLLREEKDKIEAELGFTVDWQELPGKKSSRLRITKKGENPMDETRWEEHFSWFKDKLEAYDRVLRLRVRNLNADDWEDKEQ